MLKACLFSCSSGHGCSFPIQCHRKTYCKSKALTIFICIGSSSGGGGARTKQWTWSVQSPGSSNEGKNCNSKLRRAQKVQSEQLLEISSEPEFMECTAWSHACSCNTPWNATPSLLEIFFLFLAKTQGRLIWIILNLQKQIYLTALLVKQSLRKRCLLQSKVVCFRNISSWTFPHWRWLTVDRDWNHRGGAVPQEGRGEEALAGGNRIRTWGERRTGQIENYLPPFILHLSTH